MIDAIAPYDLPADVKKQLLELAADSDLLLLGEMHGTQEVPRLVLGLLDDLALLGYGVLGLEIPAGQREPLIDWAAGKSEPPPFFGPQDFQDGRGNVQALSLVHQSVSSPRTWGVLCFDTDFFLEGETGADRDRHMAENLLEQWQEQNAGQKVLAVCGNFHSRLVAPAKPDAGPWPSFGYCVKQMRPELRVNAVNIVFQRGGFFNGEVRKFDIGAEHFAASPELRLNGQFGHTRDLYLPRATPVTFLQ
jgi:hypothetical protein